MINVLHLHSSSGLYGAESVILTLGGTLDVQGYHPIVGCLEVDKSHLSAFANAARESKLDVELVVTRAKVSPIAILKIIQLIRKRSVRLLHTHNYKATILGFFASKIAGVPLVETNHLFPPMPLSDKKLQLYAKIESFFLRYADKTIAVSHKIKTSLEASGVPEDKLCVIENGIDIEACLEARNNEREIIRHELGLKGDTFVIGGVGRLTEQKGFKYLLEAANSVLAKREDVIFIIAGDGPLREELYTYMHELKLEGHVKFLGFRSDILRILAAMDLFVMPSLDEGLPMAMLEAMASRVPVIVTAVGEIPRVIKNEENGILIETRNSKDLANKIFYILENEKIRSNIKEQGFITVKNSHSKELMTKSYTAMYDTLLNLE